jgi:hypothetical protein
MALASGAGRGWLVAAGPVASRGRAGRQAREPQGGGQPGGLTERVAMPSDGAAAPTGSLIGRHQAIAYVRAAT